jgi:hypothetical protein
LIYILSGLRIGKSEDFTEFSAAFQTDIRLKQKPKGCNLRESPARRHRRVYHGPTLTNVRPKTRKILAYICLKGSEDEGVEPANRRLSAELREFSLLQVRLETFTAERPEDVPVCTSSISILYKGWGWPACVPLGTASERLVDLVRDVQGPLFSYRNQSRRQAGEHFQSQEESCQTEGSSTNKPNSSSLKYRFLACTHP